MDKDRSRDDGWANRELAKAVAEEKKRRAGARVETLRTLHRPPPVGKVQGNDLKKSEGIKASFVKANRAGIVSDYRERIVPGGAGKSKIIPVAGEDAGAGVKGNRTIHEESYHERIDPRKAERGVPLEDANREKAVIGNLSKDELARNKLARVYHQRFDANGNPIKPAGVRPAAKGKKVRVDGAYGASFSESGQEIRRDKTKTPVLPWQSGELGAVKEFNETIGVDGSQGSSTPNRPGLLGRIASCLLRKDR